MANSLLISLLQIYLLFLSFSTCALGLAKFYVVDLHDLTSKNVCSPPKDMEKIKSVKPTLKIVDRQGPCSTLHPAEKLSPEQILSNDQSRVDSIHHRVSAIAGKGTTSGPLSPSQITAQSGFSYGLGNYIVHVGIGTPSKTLTLEFDTGSDVTWIQCKPCQTYCYKQQEPIFDPSQSSTFMNVSCNSTPCNDVSGNFCEGSSCLYGVKYGDQSYTVGYYAEDTLTLTPDMIQKFRFGCGQNNKGIGDFGEVAGLLGLGPSSESFVSQTSDKYQRVFAYCLPALSSSTGYLNFGSNSDISNTNHIPITKRPNSGPYYYITMTGLSVAGDTLPISSAVFSNAGTIIDSGTTITQLPPDAYQALRSAFMKHMTQYKMVPGSSTLDTCYDFTGVDNMTIPSVSIQFENNVSLDLVHQGILFGTSRSQLCLAFAGNSDPNDIGIFGNVQQRTFNVVYDIPKGEIGFSPDAC
ncbi:aspartyl protease family protein At5g10770-like isoform X1 [Carex rostrata]